MAIFRDEGTRQNILPQQFLCLVIEPPSGLDATQLSNAIEGMGMLPILSLSQTLNDRDGDPEEQKRTALNETFTTLLTASQAFRLEERDVKEILARFEEYYSGYQNTATGQAICLVLKNPALQASDVDIAALETGLRGLGLNVVSTAETVEECQNRAASLAAATLHTIATLYGFGANETEELLSGLHGKYAVWKVKYDRIFNPKRICGADEVRAL